MSSSRTLRSKRKWPGVLVLLAALLFAPSSSAQSVEDLPGFVDFEAFGDFDIDDLKVEINLGGSLLKMLSSAVEDESGSFADLVRGLSLVKVNIFEAGGARAAEDQLRGAMRSLRREGWETVVSIRDEENVHILLRTDGDRILGVLAAFSDAESFGLVNIVGEFDPEQIGELARELDIDALEGLDLGGVNNGR